MTILSFFRELYSLDTLDTRLTTSSKTPAKVANDESAKTATKDVRLVSQRAEGTSPPRWYTPEFYFYALVFLFCIPQMYKAVIDVSLKSSPHYNEYKHLLSPGWLFGREVDNSDGQYASFRDNVPYLLILVVVHPLLRRVYESVILPSSRASNGSTSKEVQSSALANIQLKTRLRFDFIFALIYISALHGFSALKILAILYANFKVATALPRHMVPAATWIFNISVLFANELGQGYRFTSLSAIVAPFFPGANDIGKAMDGFDGLNSRWEVLFNITVLRLISFNLDYYWSLSNDRASSPVEKKQVDIANLSERDRISQSAPSWTYTSFRTYLAYALYPPLYLAGPIVSFNDYISQSTYRPASITTRRTILYGIRFLLTLLCMELVLHTAYVVAISKANPNWSTYTPFQLSMLAYFNLHIIWLKLLIPWRFFRFWSLLDGIDPPENVIRCMSDNYSATAFWRSWHRSFNRWIVRYVYIPLGGGPGGGAGKLRGIVNMLAVFTFVALWHDINLRLLMWGWLVVLFILPEVLATMAFPKSKWKDRPDAYRFICGIGAVFNILMMMAADLVGFALGLDGLKGLLVGIFGSWQGGLFMLGACSALFVGAQIMFEHREEEIRKGIKLKC